MTNIAIKEIIYQTRLVQKKEEKKKMKPELYSVKMMIVDWIRNISKLLLETTVMESLFSQ